MALNNSKARMAAEAGILLVMPAIYMITSSILMGFGYTILYDAGLWLLHKIGAGKRLGIIHFLVSVGPVAAFLLNVFAIASFNMVRTKDDILYGLSIKRCFLNWVIIVVSGICVVILFLFLLEKRCS